MKPTEKINCTVAYASWQTRLSSLGKTLQQICKKKKNYGLRVRERTIPTERQPFVGEVIANFCG
jgi:hypothetical protein